MEPWSSSIRGKVAIVTGAAQGIGQGVAETFAAHGASVALVDIKADGVERAAGAIRDAGGKAIAVPTDLTSAQQVKRMVATVVAKFGTVDILVNVAGVLRRSPIVEMSEEEWDLVVDTCLKAAFLCSREVLPVMMARRRGKIVNVSSLAARSTSVLGSAAYTAAKAGLLGFTRHLAREAAPYGINVNATCPGATDTPMTRGAIPTERFDAMSEKVPIGRWSQPVDQAMVILFLVSDAASFITGATLDVNGGQVMV